MLLMYDTKCQRVRTFSPCRLGSEVVCDCSVLIAAGPAVDGVTVWRDRFLVAIAVREVQGVLKPVVAFTLQIMPW